MRLQDRVCDCGDTEAEHDDGTGACLLCDCEDFLLDADATRQLEYHDELGVAGDGDDTL